MQLPGVAALLLAAVSAAALPLLAHAARGRASASSGPGVQLSSSVMIFNMDEFDRCGKLLQAAATHGSRSVNIVPTFHWIDDRFRGMPQTCNPDGWAAGSRVDSYCFYRGGAPDCQPWTKKDVERATRGFTACLTEAFDLFDEVLVSPHLDDGTRSGHWRNMLVFDPLEKDANGFSYDDIMIHPITAAAEAALWKKRRGHAAKTLWFGMQGEMGGTVFHHPASYSKISKRIRSNLAGAPGTVLVGVLLNHAYLPGVINRGPDSPPLPLPASPLGPLSGGWGPLLPFDQWPGALEIERALPAARELLQSDVDFLGISNYNRAPADVTAADMEYAVTKYDSELASMGISLQGLVTAGKKFIYNEVAIGGGVSECGNVTAVQPWQVGRWPWMGIFGSYNPATDPYKTQLGPDANVPARNYMRSWYAALLQVLQRGGLKYKVHGSYLWSCGSWDVQGVYTPGYADPVMVERIRKHNAEVAAAPAST